MDAEGLKSLLWIVVWGGLFFLMMRYGCGAHIGGHGGHREREGADKGGAVKDPVCGMSVEPLKAAAASVHRGQTYYFCSTSCRDKFEQAPEKHLSGAAEARPQHGGHDHG